MRVLVVEDDPDLVEILRDGLTEEGYAVDVSTTGEEGRWRATTVDYDVAVLDVMLPDLSGFEILRAMRRGGRAAPVLVLTARDATDDRVEGLDAGADDYLVKPFAWKELLARLRALLRRGARGEAGTLRRGGLELDPACRAARLDRAPMELTPKEFDLLWALAREPGRVFARSEIEEHLYDDEHEGASNVIEVLVSRIRAKLARGARGPSIRTLRGVGYALDVDAAT